MTRYNLMAEATELAERLTAWRRELHAHPELRFDLPWTEGFVADRLEEMGWTVRTGVARHGVVGLLEVPGASGCVALRSDMDALPMREETGLPFAFPGEAMHACGHDAHMAQLLGAAELIARHREDLRVSVKLLFQPDEEGGEGARALIREGALQNPRVDRIFGCHVGCLWPELPVGQVGVRSGVLLSANDHFKIRLLGRSAHGATPHRGVDAVVMASQVVSALQALVSREINPQDAAVLTIGRIEGGTAYNVVAGEVRLEGTLRSFSEPVRHRLHRRLEEICEGVAHALGGEAEVRLEEGPPVLVNDPEVTERFARLAGEVAGTDRVTMLDRPGMVSEDFAFYLRACPGTFFFLAACDADQGHTFPHHHPRFALDERVLPLGAALLAAAALEEGREG